MLARELGGEAPRLPGAGRRGGSGKRGPGFGAKMSALLKNRTCPVPGCTNKSRGPRYRFFCAPHSESLSQAEKERYIAESKSKDGGAAPAEAAEAPAKAAKKRSRKAKKK
jgi:hypothetical protein